MRPASRTASLSWPQSSRTRGPAADYAAAAGDVDHACREEAADEARPVIIDAASAGLARSSFQMLVGDDQRPTGGIVDARDEPDIAPVILDCVAWFE
jgi:hypothetical protein